VWPHQGSYGIGTIWVLYEDNHLLGVIKPPGLPTMGVAADRPSLLTEAKAYLAAKYSKPGNVYLGVVSRLDTPVSGVVLLARTSKAAERLNRQFRERTVDKRYWALVPGGIDPPQGQLVDWLKADGQHRRVRRVAASQSGARQARLRYRRLRPASDAELLEIALETGRKHQIRAQLSLAGYPIVGDFKYGSRRKFPAGIALHARQLTVEHPTRGEPVVLTAPVPDSWAEFGIGG